MFPLSLISPSSSDSSHNIAATMMAGMRTVTTYAKTITSRPVLPNACRWLSTSWSPQHATTGRPLPWFVDPSEAAARQEQIKRQRIAPRFVTPLAPLPTSLPEDSPIAKLHAALATSPHLEPGALLVSEPIPTAVGPSLPLTASKGRRKRGRTYGGEGIPDPGAGIWSWIVVAQVRV